MKTVLAATGAVILVGAVGVLATGGRAGKLVAATGSAVDGGLVASGFRLSTVHLQGASLPAQREIMAAAALRRDAPILSLDLDGIRERVEKVGWVARARVVRLLPDTLVIAIDQRPLVAVWEHEGKAVVVTDSGSVAENADPARFPSLPLIVGDGANLAAAAIIPSISARPRLLDHLEALVRVDDRRWDLRLKDGAIIQLPGGDEQAALIRLDQLDRASHVLDLALARIDLRDPEMVVVRPREGPAPALSNQGV